MNKQITGQSARPTPGKQATKNERRRDRREEQRRLEEQRHRAKQRGRIILFSVIGVVLAGTITLGLFFYFNNSNSNPNIVPTPVNPLYPAVDGGAVICDANGHDTDYHIHAHVTIYIDGSPVQIPAQVGLPTDNSCLYWLHTHDATGVIHIEAPQSKKFTLGNFLDEWGTEFSLLGYPAQLDSTAGWTAYVCDGNAAPTPTPTATTGATATAGATPPVTPTPTVAATPTATPTPALASNCKQYTGDIHSIPLSAHELITLAYNSPGIVPDSVYSWGSL